MRKTRHFKKAAKTFSKGAERFAVEVKGEELAMRDGRVKRVVGFAYAISPIGANHVVVEHDSDFDFNAPDIYWTNEKFGSIKEI